MGWEDIQHSFQNMSLLCESMEYWWYNFIFEFWSLMQQQEQRVSHFLKAHFWLNFGILFFPWKWFFIPLRTMFQCFNVTIIGSAFSCWSFDVSHRRWWDCIIISAPNSGSILVFFFFPESDFLYLLIACFNVQMWPVLLLQFHFEFLMFPSARDGAVYHYFSPQFWFNLGVLFLPLKAIFYTFQEHVSKCKCGQYWSCNVISSFWCFLQQGDGGVYHYFWSHFFVFLGVLTWVWKV